MNAVVTGARGAVGSALVPHLREQGWAVHAWDRSHVAPTEPAAGEAWLADVRPDVVFHLAIASQPTALADEGRLINVDWAERLAKWCKAADVRLVFTSTVMVFSSKTSGPYTPESEPTETEGYGHDKLLAEQAVRAANADAAIARLGWQIGDAPGSNNMINFFDQKQREHGEIGASTRWRPACSFLADTAVELRRLAEKPRPLALLDSNRGWDFHQIASALNELHGSHWNVTANEDFVYDQRMIDPASSLPDLRRRLPTLPTLGNDA